MLSACQAASRVQEHCRSSDSRLTSSQLGSLTFLLGQVVLHCGTCHTFLPAAPSALEALVDAMQQLQVGKAGQAGGGFLGWVGSLHSGAWHGESRSFFCSRERVRASIQLPVLWCVRPPV